MLQYPTAQHRCSICDISFSFKSKLERHLKSDGHKMFIECMQASHVQEVYDFDDISFEVCIFCGACMLMYERKGGIVAGIT